MRERFRNFPGLSRIVDRFRPKVDNIPPWNLRIVVLDEPDGSLEPGVYIETDIPLSAWEEDRGQLQDQTLLYLTQNESLQKALPSEKTGVTISLGGGLVTEPERAIMLAVATTTAKGNYVVFRVKRPTIGEAVRRLNHPQAQNALLEANRARTNQSNS